MSQIIKGKNPNKPHTVRYWTAGHVHSARCKPDCAKTQTQRERSFATRAEAKAFQTDTDHAARYGGAVDSRAGRVPFGEAAQAWLEQAAVGERTRETYAGAYRKHIAPAFAGRTLAQVAEDRDAVTRLLGVTMAHLSLAARSQVRLVIVSTLDEAVRSGRIAAHRCGGITLNTSGQGREVMPPARRGKFAMPAQAQTDAIAARAGIAVHLMRWCGLRIEEALAVERSDFIDGDTVLRVSGQATRDGAAKVALKMRQPGEFRDVPVPAHIRAMVAGLPDGPLQPGRTGGRFERVATVRQRFMPAAKRAGLPPAFTPHSLRHAYVSDLLARGVPITVVAGYLGHRDVSVTYTVYGHLLPSSAAQVLAVLDRAYAEAATA